MNDRAPSVRPGPPGAEHQHGRYVPGPRNISDTRKQTQRARNTITVKGCSAVSSRSGQGDYGVVEVEPPLRADCEALELVHGGLLDDVPQLVETDDVGRPFAVTVAPCPRSR